MNNWCYKWILCLLCVFLMLSSLSYAESPDGVEMNSTNLDSFFNKVLSTQLDKYKIAGATVSIVKDGKIIYLDTFGYKDAKSKVRFEEGTLTRIGSITKVFTWTAIMKLHEEGKLNIKDNINKYVKDFNYENTYEKPITIENLMTHTAGFEDELTTLYKKSEDPEEALKNDYRRVIYEPGDIVAYSNYGSAIAGYIIEEVSGESFEDYIQNQILKPLNMASTTLHQPASELYEDVSYGHLMMGNELSPIEDIAGCFLSAGGMSTTSKDMAKFMLMHLNNGYYNGESILKKETALLMKETAYRSHMDLPGLTRGFMEWKRNNLDIIWHSGGNAAFKSMLLLIPKERIGLFISYNSAHAEKARNELREEFLDRYFPMNLEANRPIDGFKERVKRYEGYYLETRRSETNSDKLIFHMSRSKKAKANDDGTLTFRDTKYIEIEPLIFNEVGGQGVLVFEEDEMGKIHRAYQDFEPHEAYTKMKIYENPILNITLFAILIVILLFISITSLFRREVSGSNKYFRDKINRYIKLASYLHLTFPLGATLAMWYKLKTSPMTMVTGAFPWLFKVSMLGPVFGLTLTCVVIYRLIKGILDRKISKLHIRYTIAFMIVSALYSLWLIDYKLFGFYII